MEKKIDRNIPTILEAKKRINELYIKSFNRTGIIDSRVIAGISPKLISDLKSNGIILDDSYVHSISDVQIGHSLDEHSNLQKEKSRNQIPINKADFSKIIDILNSYDSIKISKNTRGLNSIIYAKLYPDGTIIYIEEIRTGRKSLSFNTMYKKDCYGGLSSWLSSTSKTTPYSNLSTNTKKQKKNNKIK